TIPGTELWCVCLCACRAMRRPRCGLPDRTPEDLVDRKKRYVLTGQRWDTDHITYRFPDQMKQSDSFGVWRRVTPLTFEELPPGNGVNGSQTKLADILLLFASGFHGDMSLFDGEGGSLAHAYYPGPGIGGDTHFDSDEPWTLDNENPKADAPRVPTDADPDPPAQPEPSPGPTSPPILSTSTTTQSPPVPEPVTPRRDIPPPPRPPKLPDNQPPDICDGDFDTVTMLRGEMFVFKVNKQGSQLQRLSRARESN
uniref:Matrix metallopeptidase 15a n=1 Tax=Neolamprologus brichardi TaxID=32507 RepID=A0A3Q4HKM1_NEOBR